jgi:hypothetical protein
MEQKDYTIENCETQRIAPKKFYQHLTETDRKNLERFLRLKQDKNYKGPKITYEYIGQQLASISQLYLGRLNVGYGTPKPTQAVDITNIAAMWDKGWLRKEAIESVKEQNSKKDILL